MSSTLPPRYDQLSLRGQALTSQNAELLHCEGEREREALCFLCCSGGAGEREREKEKNGFLSRSGASCPVTSPKKKKLTHSLTHSPHRHRKPPPAKGRRRCRPPCRRSRTRLLAEGGRSPDPQAPGARRARRRGGAGAGRVLQCFGDGRGRVREDTAVGAELAGRAEGRGERDRRKGREEKER